MSQALSDYDQELLSNGFDFKMNYEENERIRPKRTFERPRNMSVIVMHDRADRVLVTNVFATR